MNTVTNEFPGVEAFLSDDNPVARMVGRYIATDMPKLMTEWLNAERERPGVEPWMLLAASEWIMSQTIASIAAQTLDEDGWTIARDMLARSLETNFLKHCSKVAAASRQAGAS